MLFSKLKFTELNCCLWLSKLSPLVAVNRSSFAANMFVVVGDVAAKFIKTCGNGDALLHKSVREHCVRINIFAKAVLQYREKCVCHVPTFIVNYIPSIVQQMFLKMLKHPHRSLSVLNTLVAGLIQAVRKKQLIRTWLCGWISPLLFALATRRISQKTWPV